MTALILTVLATSIPLLLAATGELIAERSGVLNLGVEGMMLSGAVAALAVTLYSGNPYLGAIAGALAGLMTAGLFGFFAITLLTNQVATGLALTIFATGFSGVAGLPLVGKSISTLPLIKLPLFSSIPILGEILFSQDLLFYFAIGMVFVTSYFLSHSRYGTLLRAVGDSAMSAHTLGYNVLGVRWLAVLFGGAMAGLGGAYIPLVLTPHWAEGLTAGRGWIALALVVFASWLPWRVLLGALLFGSITILQLTGQARGWAIPPQFLSMLPYLATILALILISARGWGKESITMVPRCLGQPFRFSNK